MIKSCLLSQCQTDTKLGIYSHLSNKCGVPRLPILINSTLHKMKSPSTFVDFITKVSDVIAEPNKDFSLSHFELLYLPNPLF